MKYILSKEALKEIANITEIVGDEVSIQSNETGWTIMAADAAHVSMIRYTIKADDFVEFDKTEKDIAFPLSVLKSFLSLADDSIEIDAGQQITFKTGNITRKTGLIDSSVSKPKFPNIATSVEVILEPDAILKTIRGVNFIDYVTIMAGPDGTKVMAEGDTDSVEVLFAEQVTEQSVKANYPMDYLITALKSMPDKVTFGFDTDYPLLIDAEGCGHIEYLLAPRISQEGEE